MMGCKHALRRIILLTLHTCYLSHVAEGHRCSTRAVVVCVGCGAGSQGKKSTDVVTQKNQLKMDVALGPTLLASNSESL